MTPRGYLAPLVVPETRAFWDGLAAGRLSVQRCSQCGQPRFPPRPMCARCRCTNSTWTDVSPTGSIWSFIVPHEPLLPAFRGVRPFNVVVVELDDEPSVRMVGNVVDTDCEFVAGDLLAVGQAVELVVVEPEPGTLLPRWRLTE